MDTRLADLQQQLELEQLEVNLFRGESRDIGSAAGVRRAGAGPGAEGRDAPPSTTGASCIRCTRTSCGAATSTSPSSTSVDRSRDGGSFSSAARRRDPARRADLHLLGLVPDRRRTASTTRSSMPKVPPPEELQAIRQAAAADAREAAGEAAALARDRAAPFEFRMVQPYNPLKPRGLRAGAPGLDARRRQTARRRDAASLPARLRLRLLAARHLDACRTARRSCSGNLIMASIDHAIWFHRPAARRRLAALCARQPARFGRARLRARQLLHARRRAGREHGAGRTHTPRPAAVLSSGRWRCSRSVCSRHCAPRTSPAADERDALASCGRACTTFPKS